MGFSLVTVATILPVLAVVCAVPFAFDRMGWRFPGTSSLPPLPLPLPLPPPPPPAPHVPFAEDSPETAELVQLRAAARVIRRLLEVIGLGTIVQDPASIRTIELLDLSKSVCILNAVGMVCAFGTSKQ